MVIVSDAPSRSDILSLLRNETLAIRIRGFLDKNEVSGILRRISDVGIEYYIGDTKAGTSERKGKIGPNLFRFKNDLPAYLDRLAAFETDARPVLFAEVDVPARFRSLLMQTLNRPMDRAKAAGIALADCTVRALPGAPPHTDWIVHELPSFEAFDGLLDQFAWNVYLAVGDQGGETCIYKTPDLEAAEAMEAPSVVLKPEIGELILFRSRNVHAVTPTQGHRLTVSGFWGPCLSGTLRYWV